MTNKAFLVDYNLIFSCDTTLELRQLSQRDIIAIVSQLRYLEWGTRWMNEPANFRYNEFVAGIESRLMTPVEISCEDIENCLGTSAIIAQLQAQINNNASDIGVNSGNISIVQSLAELNAQNIVSNRDDIQLNTQNIIANKDDILLNTQNIIVNKDDIADHESRITVLESQSPATGSGDMELIHAQALTTDGQFDVIDVSAFAYWKIIYSTVASPATSQYLHLIMNGDDNAINYFSSQTLSTTPVVGRQASNVWGQYSQFNSGEIECFDSLSTDKWKRAHQRGIQVYANGGQGAIDENNLLWKNTEAIETIQLRDSGAGHGAGSSIMVWGVRNQTIAQDYEWQAVIDFKDDRNELLDTIVATYQLGSDRYINAENPLRRLALVWLLSEQIEHVRMVIDAELTGGSAVLFTEDETGLQIEQVMQPGRNEYTFETAYTRNGFSTVARDIALPGNVYFYGITLFGNGTIPPQLQVYEV